MDVLQFTREFLSEQYGVSPETITPDTKLDDLGVDSLMFIDLVFEFEDKFGVHATNDDIAKLSTIGEFVDLVNEKRQLEQS